MTIGKKSVIQRIKDKLGLTDDGKIEIFFTKQIKNLERTITTLNKNLENFKFNHEQTMETLREKLEDAQDALDAAYEDVSVEDISSNANAEAFAKLYWSRVDAAEQKVQNIEKEMEDNVKALENKTKETNEKIALTNVRIDSLK